MSEAWAVVLAGLIAVVGAVAAAYLTSRTAQSTLRATFDDQDRRASETLTAARHQQLLAVVADYVEQATTHADLCRAAWRITERARRAEPSLDREDVQRDLSPIEADLRESTSKLRRLSVRVTTLSSSTDLQREVRDLLQYSWHEREVALGRAGAVERSEVLTDAAKAMRHAVWPVIRQARLETGVGEEGMLDRTYFVSGDSRRRKAAAPPQSA